MVYFKITYHDDAGERDESFVFMPLMEPNYVNIRAHVICELRRHGIVPAGVNEVPLRLYWQDADGDQIRISDEWDFKCMTTLLRAEKMRRLHVYRMTESQEQAPEPEPEPELVPEPVVAAKQEPPAATAEPTPVTTEPTLSPGATQSERVQHYKDKGQLHNTVQCDTCFTRPLLGFRYKCLQCPDFDLCSVCESQLEHSEHMIMRMPTCDAKNWPFVRDFWQAMQNALSVSEGFERGHDLHIMAVCNGCQASPIAGYRYKCIQCDDFNLCQVCELAGKHAEHVLVRMPGNACITLVSQCLDKLAELAASKKASTAKKRRATIAPMPMTRVLKTVFNLVEDLAGMPELDAKVYATSFAGKRAKANESKQTKQKQTNVNGKQKQTNVNGDGVETKAKPTVANEQKEHVEAAAAALDAAAPVLKEVLLPVGVGLLNSFNDVIDAMSRTLNEDVTVPVVEQPTTAEQQSENGSVATGLHAPEQPKVSEHDANEAVNVNETINKTEETALATEEKQSVPAEIFETVEQRVKAHIQSVPVIKAISTAELEEIVRKVTKSLIIADGAEQACDLAASTAESALSAEESNTAEQPVEFVDLNVSSASEDVDVDMEWQMLDEVASNASETEQAEKRSNASDVDDGAAAATVASGCRLSDDDEDETASSSKFSIIDEPANDANVDDNISSTSKGAVNVSDEQHKPSAPELLSETEQVFHADEKINRSVKQMIEMGFNNQGGWLSLLLDAVNGDINKALEIMGTKRNN